MTDKTTGGTETPQPKCVGCEKNLKNDPLVLCCEEWHHSVRYLRYGFVGGWSCLDEHKKQAHEEAIA